MELIDLVVKAQNGSEPAFAKLLTLTSPVIRDVARKYYNCEEMVNEAVQLCRVKLWRNIKAFNPEKGTSVRAWIYRVSQNCCLDLKRADSRRKWDYMEDVLTYKNNEGEVVYFDVLFKGENPEEMLASKEMIEALYAFIDMFLDNRQKTILCAMHIDGKTQIEIAEEFGLTSNNVGAIVCRAMAQLKRKVSKLR